MKKFFLRLSAMVMSCVMVFVILPEYHFQAATTKLRATKDKKDGLYKDDKGNVIDLGGMEITIRDWWSSGERKDSPSAYEQAQYDYWDEIMETYNFKIKEVAIGDWGTVIDDFVDYVAEGGDENNYAFVLRNDTETAQAMYNGLMYDVKTLDCLDFTNTKFQRNKSTELYSFHNSVYSMSAEFSEPRVGVFFNKPVLKAAGINPESIYDMQKNGKWTWEAFEKLLAKVQKDEDGDGQPECYAIDTNRTLMALQAVYSNGGAIISKDSKGNYKYNLENKKTLKALDWIDKLLKVYPPVGDYNISTTEFKNGKCGFLVYDMFVGLGYNYLTDMSKDDVGFVMFPSGPDVKKGGYISEAYDNPVVIPACYSEDKAWKIAFAYNLYTEPVPGFEDYNEIINEAEEGVFDSRAISETIPLMCMPEHKVVEYYYMIPGLEIGPDFMWGFGSSTDTSTLISNVRKPWKNLIKKTNKNEIKAGEIKAIGKPAIKSVKLNADGIPVITWKSVKNVTGYEVYRYTPTKTDDGYYTYKWVKIATTKKTKYKDSKLPENTGKTIEYKVRAYKKTGKTKIYSKEDTEQVIIPDPVISAPEYYTFELSEDGKSYILTGLSSFDDVYESRTYQMPSSYKGLPVTKIGDEAFNCVPLSGKIIIPEGITEIGDSAFYLVNCDIEFPSTLKIVGKDAFTRRWKSLTFPEGVTSIGDHAFTASTGDIYIPDSVTDIGIYECAEGLYYLNSISVPKHLKQWIMDTFDLKEDDFVDGVAKVQYQTDFMVEEGKFDYTTIMIRDSK